MKKDINKKGISKNNKIKNYILTVLLIFFSALFIYSGYKIIRWKIDSNNTKKEIKEINKKVKIKDIEDNDKTIIIEQENIPKEDPYWDFIKLNLIDVDFSKLLATNKNTKGWIQISGTNINYPFVQTTDNSFYLTHSFNNSYNEAGWVFMDYRNDIENFDKNTILYAHGRYDNTMFGTLKDVFKNDWLNNTSNYTIKISTPYENTLWQVFSVYKIKTTDDYIQIYFKDNNEYQDFLNLIANRTMHDFGTTVSTNDNILTLSTCYNETEKVVLHAKLIKKEIK